MAAGGVLWHRDDSGEAVAVMALEMRQGKPRYNFLGGKRDTEEETPRIVAQREASEESGEALSADARRRMAQGDAMRPVLWHAGGKYCLFVFELPPADADLVERITARGGQPDSGDPELLSLHWVPLRRLLEGGWCKANLHSYVSDQLTLLRPYLARIVAGRPPLLGARVGDAVPLPFGAPALFIERQHANETMAVLVSGSRRAQPRAQPQDEVAVAAAERARSHAQKQPEGCVAWGGATVAADAARAVGATASPKAERQQGGGTEPPSRDSAQVVPPRKPRQEKERRPPPAPRACSNFGTDPSAVAGISDGLAYLTVELPLQHAAEQSR